MKPKILLVEDNQNNRYLAQFLLEREGMAVKVAFNGKQALEMALQETPELVVMDIQMPEMDGYETARQFKRDTTLAHIPLIGVSSFAMAGDRGKALRCGFAAYVEKPIDPETFGKDVKGFLAVKS
jgi:two-component system cell cycle response regulator DivK